MSGPGGTAPGTASAAAESKEVDERSAYRQTKTALYIWMGSFISVVLCTTPMYFFTMLTTSLNLGYVVFGRPRLGRRVWVGLAVFALVSLVLIHFTFGIFRFW